MFHKHKMIEHVRIYAPPFAGRYEGYISQENLLKCKLGVTTIVFKCNVGGCTKIEKIECLGKEVTVDELEKMVRRS